MPPITRNDRDQVFDRNGNVVSEKVVERDITEESNDSTLRQRADQALAGLRTLSNTTGTLTAAQLSDAVRLLARAVNALIRLALRKLDAAD